MPAESQLPTDRPVALRKKSRTNHRQTLPASQASPGPILLVFVSHFRQYSIVSRALCVLSHSCMHVCTFSRFSRVLLFATLRTVALHSPLSKGFFRKAQLCPTLCALPLSRMGSPREGLTSILFLAMKSESGYYKTMPVSRRD